MHIGIDIRALSTGRRTGVEEYSVNLLPHIFSVGGNKQYSLFYNGWRPAKTRLPGQGQPNVKLVVKNWPNRLLNTSLRFLRYPRLNRLLGDIDLYFEPVFEFSRVDKNIPRVVVFHDLSFERFPEYFSRKQRLWHDFVNPRALARSVDGIIADSYSTKQDLVKLYQVDPGKIRVVYPGIPDRYSPEEQKAQADYLRSKYNLPRKFILYLGTLEPRKNISGLIRAFDLLVKNNPETKQDLVIAGRPGWLYQDILAEARQASCASRIHFAGFIDSQDKPYIYGLADLFVYPSFYEGFGFPPLEAMRAGVPVVTSAVSSLPEVAGDAALLVDPHNINEIAKAIEEGLSDQALREDLRQKGHERAKRFLWDKTAEGILGFWKDVVKDSNKGL